MGSTSPPLSSQSNTRTTSLSAQASTSTTLLQYEQQHQSPRDKRPPAEDVEGQAIDDTKETTNTKTTISDIPKSSSSLDAPHLSPGGNVVDLERQLELREREIQLLKSELDKYKLALKEQQQLPLPQNLDKFGSGSCGKGASSALSTSSTYPTFPLHPHQSQQHQHHHHQQQHSPLKALIECDERNLATDEVQPENLEASEESTLVYPKTEANPSHFGQRLEDDQLGSERSTNVEVKKQDLSKFNRASSTKTQSDESKSSERQEPVSTISTERPLISDRNNNKSERDHQQQMFSREDKNIRENMPSGRMNVEEQDLEAVGDNDNLNDSDGDNDLDDIINEVGEIDLDLELDLIEPSKDNKPCRTHTGLHEESRVSEADQENLSDGLLTSLTDAAINNLSQLAALQERCESQQHQQHHSHRYQQTANNQQQQKAPFFASNPGSAATLTTAKSPVSDLISSSSPSSNSPSFNHPLGLATQRQQSASSHLIQHQQSPSQHHSYQHQNRHQHQQPSPVPSSDDYLNDLLAGSPNLQHHHHHHQQRVQPHHHHLQVSAEQNNPLMSVGVDALNTNSLANVVVAAAAAAAAANDQNQQHHQALNRPQGSMSVGGGGPSSLMSSPDFYHFQQHYNPQLAQQQAQGLRQHLQQQQQQQQQHPLHYSPSPSGSLNQSSSSLLGTQSPQSLSSILSGQHHHHRSSSTKTPITPSSGQLSPISSPNFLRRQFIVGDRFSSMISHSPTGSGLIGSSAVSSQAGGSSASLSHILHQQQQHLSQQRSVSALGGGVGAGSFVQSALTSASSSSLISSGVGSSAVSPMMSNKNSSQARLNNMQIRHKFGYLGSGRAQFNSPHGFCLGLDQEIVVADTNNHRVCIFDKSGTYITQFGSPGKEEGQLWNPRKVAILHRPTSRSGKSLGAGAEQFSGSSAQHHQLYSSPSNSSSQPSSASCQTGTASSATSLLTTGAAVSAGQCLVASGINSSSSFTGEPLYVVCDRGAERSRMQLFTKEGTFVKKIAIHYIDIVAGLAITQNGLIIVVDSVSPTVYIINGETGVLNNWFDCSGHMKEPSDIAVKSDIPVNEYFICDFKGHCVVVFSEQGEYLRRIGHDGLTSYPNGIDISDDGDILVGDSHGNRFHVVVFDRNGSFVSQFECPHVKVSRCCGLKITREGYIVTLAKNNHHVLVLDTIHI